MNGTPPDPDTPDDVDDRYRRASALDPSRPSAAVRSAVLEHAANLAAQRAGNTHENLGATVVTLRPAEVRPWRRPAIFGTLAAAALAGLLITPHLLPPHEDSRQKTAMSPAPRAPAAEAPRNEPAPTNFVADEMRSPASPPAPLAPSPDPPRSAALSALRASQPDAARLARQSEYARKAAPAAEVAAPSVTADGGSPAGGAASAQSAQVQSVTVTAARRTDTAAALRQAAEAGDMVALQALLSRQADIDRASDSSRSSAIDARDGSGRTALMLAARNGRRAAVDALLAAGADPNAADAHGTTPLQAAIAGGQPEIIAALQRAGAH
jgi:hypothetical protein